MKKDKKWLLREFRKLTFELQNGYAKVKAVDILPLIDQLEEQEQEKVKVPQFVADWINQAKKWEYSIGDSIGHVSFYLDTDQYDKAMRWAKYNQNIFARAWLDGYEIEKEKLYYVKLPNTNSKNEYLYLAQGISSGDLWFNSKLELIKYDVNTCRHQFTESEIKSINEYYWQFVEPIKEEY